MLFLNLIFSDQRSNHHATHFERWFDLPEIVIKRGPRAQEIYGSNLPKTGARNACPAEVDQNRRLNRRSSDEFCAFYCEFTVPYPEIHLKLN